MSNIKVVVFEDNTNLRRGLTTLINGSDGFECTGAFGNCDNLVKNITDTKPDVVLMDIELPGIDGIEALKILKPQFPGLKVLVETVFEDDEKVFHCICNGAEGYILKNSPPGQLFEAIREIHEGESPMTPGIASKVLAMFKPGTSLNGRQSHLLSSREKEILKYLVDGMSYKAVADKCFITTDELLRHVKSIYRKVQVHAKSEAMGKAIKGKIV
jgi:DNA-binding NarL/FixJ family response regulator